MNSGGADAYRFLQRLTISDVVAHAEQMIADAPTSSAALYKPSAVLLRPDQRARRNFRKPDLSTQSTATHGARKRYLTGKLEDFDDFETE